MKMKREARMAAARAFNGVVIVCVLFVLCSGASVQAQFSAKVYHDGGTSNEWPGKMIKTGDGNVAMCGYADSTKPILRLDENMVLAPDPTAVVAQMNTHVMKMTQDGQTLWKTVLWDSPPRMVVNSQMCAKSIAELSDGGFVVTGWLREGVILRKNLTDPNKIQYPVDPGQTLAFVSRLDANGKELWRRFILPHPMLYSEYATRASGADIVVRRGNPDEIVIVGVAELLEEWPNFSKTAKQMQLPAELEKSYLSCFQTQWKTTRLSGKYVWLAVLREKDDKVINPCKGQPNPTNENPQPKDIDMKVPEMVYCRQYFPSTNSIGKIKLEYNFRFDQPAGQSESELTSTINNGVFQDHVFASITETPGDASGDGYAISVNATTTEELDNNRKIQPIGFTILKVDRQGSPQWWQLYYNPVIGTPTKANKLTSANILYYSESTGNVRRLMVCGKNDEDSKAVRTCTDRESGAKENIMLAIVSPNGVPQALYDYASPKTEYSIRTDVHNDAAFSLVQVPPTGTDPDLRRYSDRGVTIFGSRYASILGERGLAENEHQGWVMRLMFRNGIANMPMVEASSSVGHDHDDHFVSGVVFESDGGTYRTFGLGHTASDGYRNSTTLPMDMDAWVARLNHVLLYDDGTCGSVKVPYCEAKLQLLATPFTYDICDRGEFWPRNPNYCVRREIREEVNCP